MFRRHHTTYLPLLLSGLPVLAVEWLRIAGLSVVPFQTPPALSRRGDKAAGQILVFDARSPTGRLDARTARECGAEIINVAEFLSRDSVAPLDDSAAGDIRAINRRQADRAAFLEELKQRIESVGGFWLRLGDYPFPYQSAACRCLDPGGDLRAFTESIAVWQVNAASLPPVSRTGTPDDALTTLKQRYVSGQPVFMGDVEPPRQPLAAHAVDQIEAGQFPLMWQTTNEEFRRWRRVRSQIGLTAWKTGTTYRVQSAGDFAGFRPSVELWLGSHVASLPLVGESMTIREEGVAFVQEHRRHPGGMAAAWAAESGLSDATEQAARQSV